MPFKLSIFNKILILLCLLLVPIVFLYSYSNQVGTDVIEREIKKSNASRLSFFIGQVNSTADQLWKAAFNLSGDPDAAKLMFKSIRNASYDVLITKELITAKAALQSNTFGWDNEFTIFAPGTGQTITTNSSLNYDVHHLQAEQTESWAYRKMVTDHGEDNHFIRYLTEPYMKKMDLNKANLIVEVAFPASNISNMLDQLQQGSRGAPFFYHPDYEPITGTTYDAELLEQAVEKLHGLRLEASGYREVEINGKPYILTYEKSKALDWYLVDFTPLGELLQPITDSRNIFYISTGLLLALSLLAAALLYRNVQMPIREMILSVKKLKKGDYSARVSAKTNNEFQYLFDQFNHMTEEIQLLIESVFAEKLRVREATLKQLQSQINPHFLYNSFAFIQSMAQLENKEAIIAVTQRLSKYYRYTTRVENQTGSMSEEIELIRNYLDIHTMKMHRLKYEIDIPDELLALTLPRLLLQPIVENAILHGIGEKPGPGMIRITGSKKDGITEIVVEDNGPGLTTEQLMQLKAKLQKPMDDEIGCGLWNIRQRLVHQFGPGSDLHVEVSPLGGLRVAIRIM
ncbi:histidine kinase [Paenibacillus pasadenensis]|uniref:histidine kinase n=1 Tax=Paenibacillus pasadenensis TaxID=217090 RepID=UPI00203B7150|nr:histidine kinase [Paenibacillus pasadenensis]MCM3746598.1 histidine kinase [Paenibacillus pasadenensis]